ncbi:MAG: hypothetical protein ACKOUM_02275, partial [Sphingopyxis sp.]
MVSAPSIRKQRRAQAQQERRAARGGRRAPIITALLVAGAVGALAVGAMAVRAWTSDPLARGREALDAGNYRAARIDLMNAVASAPADSAVRLDLARAY